MTNVVIDPGVDRVLCQAGEQTVYSDRVLGCVSRPYRIPGDEGWVPFDGGRFGWCVVGWVRLAHLMREIQRQQTGRPAAPTLCGDPLEVVYPMNWQTDWDVTAEAEPIQRFEIDAAVTRLGRLRAGAGSGAQSMSEEEFAEATAQDPYDAIANGHVAVEWRMSRAWHIMRIARLVSDGWLEAVCIDWARGRRGGLYIEDGNHRVAAACYRRDRWVLISYAGPESALRTRLVRGKRPDAGDDETYTVGVGDAIQKKTGVSYGE